MTCLGLAVCPSGGDADVINGGAGSDTLDLSGLTDAEGNALSAADVTFTSADKTAGTIAHGGGTITFSGIEFINFGSGAVSVATFATSGDDTITLGSGVDTIDALAGDDVVYGGAGGDVSLEGGAGADTLYGGSGADRRLHGGSGDDVIYGGAGNDSALWGGVSGNDTIYGGSGADFGLHGGAGDDLIYGGAGNDADLVGRSGSDTIYGGAGSDTLDGRSGDDVLGVGGVSAAGGDADVISGGAGDDTLDLVGLTDADGNALSAADVTFTSADKTAGTIAHGGGTITFSGIEFINFGSGAVSVATFATAGDDIDHPWQRC